MKEKIAVLAITKHGIKIAQTIKKNVDVKIFAPHKYHDDEEYGSNINWYSEQTSKIILDLFRSYDALICVFSLGAVIRLISSLIVDKKRDPAVLVIDDKASFVISALSGHLGGANELSRHIASFLNAIPVITTAADVNKTIAVDLLGNEFGWTIEKYQNVTKASAHMVNEEKIAIFQDAGEKKWWDIKNLPKNVKLVNNISEINEDSFKAGLIITDKMIEYCGNKILSKSVIYRPKTLVIGVGVHWDTTKDDILEGIKSVLKNNGFVFSSVKSITSIKKKIEVPGLDAFSKEFGIPLFLYEKNELDKIKVPNPSDIVKKFEGVGSVSEASCLLHSKGQLVVPKQKFPPKLTIAVSKVNF